MKDTLTDPFPYAIGVYQRDPLSVAIFNTITCLLGDALSSMSMSTVGYQISSTKETVDVLLFAEDAVLISNSLKNSQRQCNMVETFLQWTGMQAKVVKYRSLAFRSRPRSMFFDPNLQICGETIPFAGHSDNVFLGLPIDLSLSPDRVMDIASCASWRISAIK